MDELTYYDFYEPYNKSKDYTNPLIINNKTYTYKMKTINKKIYIVAIEIIPDDELKNLIINCQCDKCIMEWYEITKYFIDGKDFGCLKCICDLPDMATVKKTRFYIESQLYLHLKI